MRMLLWRVGAALTNRTSGIKATGVVVLLFAFGLLMEGVGQLTLAFGNWLGWLDGGLTGPALTTGSALLVLVAMWALLPWDQRQPTGHVERVLKILPPLKGQTAQPEVTVDEASEAVVVTVEGLRWRSDDEGAPPERLVEKTNLLAIRESWQRMREEHDGHGQQPHLTLLYSEGLATQPTMEFRAVVAALPWLTGVATEAMEWRPCLPDDPQAFERSQQAVDREIEAAIAATSKKQARRVLVDVTSGTPVQRIAAIYAAVVQNVNVGLVTNLDGTHGPTRWKHLPLHQ